MNEVKILIILIILVISILLVGLSFGFMNNKKTKEQTNVANISSNINNSKENTAINNVDNKDNNKVDFKPSDYVIQVDANLLGEEFELSENEIKQYNYEISFLDDNSFKINMGSGNSVQGNYVVSDDIITCNLTHASGEYSPTQEINGKISFKINSNSEIEIISIPEFYTIKLSELSDSGWVLTDETKKTEFWPLVKGIKYILNK